MNMKCRLGIHDLAEGCQCSRCGKTKRDDVIIDLTNSAFRNLTPDRLQERVNRCLKRHVWDGCKCVRCGTEHAWALVGNVLLKRSSCVFIGGASGKGLYKMTFKCLLCGADRVTEEWIETHIG